jgi:hypothetical protein
MQRWEYLFISAYLTSNGWQMPLGPDQTLATWADIVTAIQAMGDEGWELVSTTSIVYPGNAQVEYAFAFKRPKE